MPIGDKAKALAMSVSANLRLSGYRVDMCYEDVKLGNMFKRAERKGAQFAVIIGEDEVNKEEVVIKNLKTTEQKSYPLDKLVEVISSEMGDECCGDNCSCHHKE